MRIFAACEFIHSFIHFMFISLNDFCAFELTQIFFRDIPSNVNRGKLVSNVLRAGDVFSGESQAPVTDYRTVCSQLY